MSCDWYMACTTCRKAVHVAQDGGGGFTFYSGEPACMKALGTFLGAHSLCNGNIQFLPEQNVIDDFESVEWRAVCTVGVPLNPLRAVENVKMNVDHGIAGPHNFAQSLPAKDVSGACSHPAEDRRKGGWEWCARCGAVISEPSC